MRADGYLMSRSMLLVLLLVLALGTPTLAQTGDVLLTVTLPGPGYGIVTSSPTGLSCTSTCSAFFPVGTNVTLTATPDPGFAVASWSGDCEGPGTTCSLILQAPSMAVTSFKVIGDPYTLRRHLLPGGVDGRWAASDPASDGTFLYGVASGGGRADLGVIFRTRLDGSDYQVLRQFVGGPNDGALPLALTLVAGTLFGTTYAGGVGDVGTVFRMDLDGSDFSVLHSFSWTDGAHPSGSVTFVLGTLYGMTIESQAGRGTLYSVRPDGSSFSVLHVFQTGSADGGSPVGALTLAGGLFYGMTAAGGAHGSGTIFAVQPDGTGFAVLHSFGGGSSDGSGVSGTLTVASGALYGMTFYGGVDGNGTIFTIGLDGSDFAVLHSFASGSGDGYRPFGSLTAVSDALYGMASQGGVHGLGTIFSIGVDGSGFGVLHSFAGGSNDGSGPRSSMTLASGVLYGMTARGGAEGEASWSDNGTLFRINPDGTSFSVLHSFTGAVVGGGSPRASLVPVAGELFGTTSYGGTSGYGTVFKVKPDGSGSAVLHSFGHSPDDGRYAHGSLVFIEGALYGMASGGGDGGYGTIFSIQQDGTSYRLLHSFTGADGAHPHGSLTLVSGALYGMTPSGGTNDNGTIFTIQLNGTGFAVLHDFASSTEYGDFTRSSLVLAAGALYGVTCNGGINDDGMVFRIMPDGTQFSVLHSFTLGSPEGSSPRDSLAHTNGRLFGMTAESGSGGNGTVFGIDLDGTNFGVLHTFAGGSTDGSNPSGSLTVAGDALYGMTWGGGSTHYGTVFTIKPDGMDFQVLHSFARWSDGDDPVSSLTLAFGMLFGMTPYGGIADAGCIFSLGTKPSVTSQDRTTFTVGEAGRFTVTTNGMPAPALALRGKLPRGVSFVNGGDGSATLSGVPAAGTGGTYPLTFTASNGVSPDATQSFTLKVIPTASTTVTLVSSRNPACSTCSVRFTARVSFFTRTLGVPTGTIQFTVDGENLGSPFALVSAQASSPFVTLPASGSPYQVTATYSGDGNFLGSSATLRQTVGP